VSDRGDVEEGSMSNETRTAVVTGASDALGRAVAVDLHRRGWTVVALLRSAPADLSHLHAAIGPDLDDTRLLGIQMAAGDEASLRIAAEVVTSAVGAPDAIVHPAVPPVTGMVEETVPAVFDDVLTASLREPMVLTRALLPMMRTAGRGRIVVCAGPGSAHGQPGMAASSAAAGALVRWAEALSAELAPFGLGVTVLRAEGWSARGTDVRDLSGVYSQPHLLMAGRADRHLGGKLTTADLAAALAAAAQDTAPLRRRDLGSGATLWTLLDVVVPDRLVAEASRRLSGLPPFGALRDGAYYLTPSQRAMVKAAQVVPQPVMTRIAGFLARRAEARTRARSDAAAPEVADDRASA
jgi:NAD(P)-dependent dehydrogenase (short-subunit alcohol dehydrogenase family)